MYTIDDEQKDLYEDEDYESSNWDNRKNNNYCFMYYCFNMAY